MLEMAVVNPSGWPIVTRVARAASGVAISPRGLGLPLRGAVAGARAGSPARVARVGLLGRRAEEVGR